MGLAMPLGVLVVGKVDVGPVVVGVPGQELVELAGAADDGALDARPELGEVNER